MNKLAVLSNRIFHSKLDKLLKRVPALGKILSSIFGAQEWTMLEFFRFLDRKLKINTIKYVNRYIFKGRWGGKVIPLNLNISADSRFLPTQEILNILSRSKVRGIGECYCRTTQRKEGKKPNCDHPTNTCIHIGFGKSLYDIPYKSERLKKVSKHKIKEVLEECDRRGLVHQLIYYPNPQFYYIICNCCPCCCVVMNKFLKIGSPQMIKSDFLAKTNSKRCKSCGICETWCYFDARKLINNTLHFDSERCFGCGICVSKCPEHAIELVIKP